MFLRPRPLSSLLATFVVAAVLSQAASCALETYGTQPPSDTTPCNADDACDDKDPCTVDFCSETKVCGAKPVVDGIAPEQTAGDCKLAVCQGGILVQSNDDEDLPNDLESCTEDKCAGGMAVHMPLADGDSCTLGPSAGLCEAGKCVVDCSAQKPCNDGNPCTEDTCNANTGKCAFANLDGLPTPGYSPVVGDCRQRICLVGVDENVVDDTDVPNDDNTCTKDGCSMGMPTQTPVNAGLSCVSGGIPGVCDAAGLCQQCVEAADCTMLPADNGCRTRTCINNVCGQTFEPTGKAIASQPGDCKKTVCDGTGGTSEQVDNTDVPNDGNVCTQDLCTAGAPSNPPDPTKANMPCGMGAATCDASGQCLGCTLATDCPGVDDDCQTRTCNNKQCGFTYAPAGTVVSSGQVAEDCKVIQCDGMGNQVSVVDPTDAIIDNSQCILNSCNAMGDPVTGFAPLGTDCNENGGTVCNGFGSCLDPDGVGCAAGGECISGFCIDGVCCNEACPKGCMACNVMGSAGTCVNVQASQEDAPTCTGTNSCDGMGVCKRDNGQPCGMNAECTSGFCADGVCCNSACDETCKSCNLTGTVGTCTLVPNDNADPGGINPCVVPYLCDGKGACKALNGVTCSQSSQCLSNYCVDGFCCNNICNQLCKGCSGALTGGNNGVCGNILNGTDPQNECLNSECNGAGVCTVAGTLSNGSACTAAGQCLSGYCVDGVCCDSACTGLCQACSATKKGMGPNGTCALIKSETPDTDNECGGGRCDGAGACKFYNGAACTLATQCFSNYCVDGYCCGNICNQLCRACSGALTGGTNGVCGNILTGTDPADECAGASTCSGGSCTP